MDFTFDGATGNLTSRTGMISQAETFQYGDVDRLKKVFHGSTEIMSIEYASNGNITTKTGLGLYGYGDGAGPHALTSVQNTGGLINDKGQRIDYNAFNKAYSLKDTTGTDAWDLTIGYGPDQQRWKTELKKNGGIHKKVIFAGNYERVTQGGATRGLYYISGGDGLAAIYVKQSGQADRIYYIHPDHLGSIVGLSDANGTLVEQYRYDPWGRRRNPVTWDTANVPAPVHITRGFTGHEHLDEFSLINMNGRVYDPLLGMFLSPDDYIQAPDFSQNFNRYNYALNNPLVYTDPDGEWVAEALAILVYAYYGGTMANFWHSAENNTNPFNPGNWDWGSFNTYYGIASGAFQGYSNTLQFCEYIYDINNLTGSPKTLISHIGDGKFDIIHYGYWLEEEHKNFLLLKTVVKDIPLGGVDNIRTIASSNLMAGSLLNALVGGGYAIEMNRIAESPKATVSEFRAYGPTTPLQPISGYILEPGGPSTTARGLDRRVPAGIFDVSPYSSINHPNVYRISNDQVPADRYILIHTGNYHSNTEACLLPGSSYSMVNGNYAVWNSTAKLNQLRSLLSTNNATLIIRDFNLVNLNFGW